MENLVAICVFAMKFEYTRVSSKAKVLTPFLDALEVAGCKKIHEARGTRSAFSQEKDGTSIVFLSIGGKRMLL
jgi:hypothetical protein